MIINTKSPIDFTKQIFTDNMKLIKHRIDKILNVDLKEKLQTKESTTLRPSIKNRRKLIELNEFIFKWTEGDVIKWLTDKNIHPVIANNLASFDGKILCEFYMLKEETPHFFYESITAGKGSTQILVKDVTIFLHELKHLLVKN